MHEHTYNICSLSLPPLNIGIDINQQSALIVYNYLYAGFVVNNTTGTWHNTFNLFNLLITWRWFELFLLSFVFIGHTRTPNVQSTSLSECHSCTCMVPHVNSYPLPYAWAVVKYIWDLFHFTVLCVMYRMESLSKHNDVYIILRKLVR